MVDIAVVLAAGDGIRWNNFLDTPKHLVPVDGEPILHRTVRLLLQQQNNIDVWVAAPRDLRYRRHDARTLTVVRRPGIDADKFYSSIDVWEGRDALLVYGDCIFTESAIDTMCRPVDEWTLYCRPGPSDITGGWCGECWGYSIPVADQAWFIDRLQWITGMHTLGEVSRSGGWELYRALTRRSLHDHVTDEHVVVIDDETEDMDYGTDYIAWMQKCRGITVANNVKEF